MRLKGGRDIGKPAGPHPSGMVWRTANVARTLQSPAGMQRSAPRHARPIRRQCARDGTGEVSDASRKGRQRYRKTRHDRRGTARRTAKLLVSGTNRLTGPRAGTTHRQDCQSGTASFGAAQRGGDRKARHCRDGRVRPRYVRQARCEEHHDAASARRGNAQGAGPGIMAAWRCGPVFGHPATDDRRRATD